MVKSKSDQTSLFADANSLLLFELRPQQLRQVQTTTVRRPQHVRPKKAESAASAWANHHSDFLICPDPIFALFSWLRSSTPPLLDSRFCHIFLSDRQRHGKPGAGILLPISIHLPTTASPPPRQSPPWARHCLSRRLRGPAGFPLGGRDAGGCVTDRPQGWAAACRSCASGVSSKIRMDHTPSFIHT